MIQDTGFRVRGFWMPDTGFKIHDASHSVVASDATADLTYVDETGISANTQYTRHIHAYNGEGDSSASSAASKNTRAASPSIASSANYVELAGSSNFMPAFIQATYLGN